MYYICYIKDYESLYCKCEYSVGIFAWYVPKWVFYSGLCAARSALSSVATIKGFVNLSDHPLISRYLKDNYDRHPVFPKYSNTWDMPLL